MKFRILPLCGLLLSLALPFAGCSKQEARTSEATPAAEPDSAIAMQPIPRETTDIFAAGDDDPDEDGISEAPVSGIALEQTTPKNLQLNPALAEIVRLSESGVEEEVLQAYVAKAPTSFNLGPEEIIYLNDIGVSSAVVLAMIQHDRGLKETAKAPVPLPAPPSIPEAAPPAETELASDVSEMTPEYENVPSESPAGIVTYTGMYDALQPYGSWVNVEGYGRCWQPAVVVANGNWAPYRDHGHWAYTDTGWYWMSDYSWGWAPFHYGRWFQHSSLGWCWTPDLVWGPSWVTWRYTGDYCGWAPLPPRTRFKPGVGLVVAGHVVPANSDCGVKAACYTFVPFRNLRDHRLGPAVLPRQEVTRIFDRAIVSTRFSGNQHVIVNNGLPAEHVAAVTHSEVHRVPARDLVARTPQSPQQFGAVASVSQVPVAPLPDQRGDLGPGRLPRTTPVRSPTRHEIGAVPSAQEQANLAPAPVQTPPGRAVLDPIAHTSPTRGSSSLAVIRNPARREIQSATPENLPPGSLLVRGQRGADAIAEAVLPRQPAWVQTANDDSSDDAAARQAPTRAVRTRQANEDRSRPERSRPSSPQVVIVGDAAPVYQPPQASPSGDQSDWTPPGRMPPPVRLPPHQMPPPAQMPPPVEIPPHSIPARGGLAEAQVRTSGGGQPRESQAVESRTSGGAAARQPSQPDSRSDSQNRPPLSGRR